MKTEELKPSQLKFEVELEIAKKLFAEQTKGEENPLPDKAIADEFQDEIRAMLKRFSDMGHSGMSAGIYAPRLAHIIKQVLLQNPICPITGYDEEWGDTISSREEMFQNKRQSSIFKDGKDGRAYFLDAIVWQGEDDWDSFSGSIGGISSRQYIKSFPFTSKTFYIDVYREPYDESNPKHQECQDIVSCGPGDMAYFLKDPKQLEEVFEYYDKYEKKTKGTNNQTTK